MKTLINSLMTMILILSLGVQLELTAQEREAKKALDAFINATTKSSTQTPVSDAEIIKATVILPDGIYIPDKAPSEKTQFDVILKSRILTDKNGEFSITITQDQFKFIPDTNTFHLKLKIKPPKDFKGVYDSDEATVKLKQKDGPTYKLILNWIPSETKSNKGTFAVSAKAQT